MLFPYPVSFQVPHLYLQQGQVPQDLQVVLQHHSTLHTFTFAVKKKYIKNKKEEEKNKEITARLQNQYKYYPPPGQKKKNLLFLNMTKLLTIWVAAAV